MTTRRFDTAASASLFLMFAALLVIYVVVPQNSLVTFFSVVIMAIGLIIAVVGDRDEIMTMALLAGLVSGVAAFFWGESLFGRTGAWVATIAWLLLLFFIARRASAETVVIPEDHAFMVAPFLSSEAYTLTSTVPLPSLPFLDRHVATIPMYELTRDVKVENINLRARHNVNQIDAHIRYQVTDPVKALRGIPNRGTIQSEIAGDAKNVSRARMNVDFWEKLLAKQMDYEVDDIVRKVAFGAGSVTNLADAYNERESLSKQVADALQELVARWGVTIKEVALDYFVLDKDAMKGLKPKMEQLKDELLVETQKKQNEASNEAYRIEQISNSQMKQIQELVTTLQQLGMKQETIEQIVIAALLSDSNDDDTDIARLLMAPANGSSGGAKPPDPPKK